MAWLDFLMYQESDNCREPALAKPKPWYRRVCWYDWLGIAAIIGACVAMAIAGAGCASNSSATTNAPLASGQKIIEKLDPNTGKVMERTTLAATATGTGSQSRGDKVEQQTNSQPAMVQFNGDLVASGGGAETNQSAKTTASILAVGIAGIIMLVLAGVAFYLQMRRCATVLGVAGASLVAISLWPALLIYGVLAVVLWQCFPYFWSELRASRATSALSAVVAGIEGVGAVTQHEIKSEVDKQATETDRKEIKKLKAREDL
jgi:hypothetical protein